MSSPTNVRCRAADRIDGWRWAGRFFLLFMLVYTAVPMLWMMVTSYQVRLRGHGLPPEWWPGEPTLASYRNLLDPQNSVGKDFLQFLWNSPSSSTLTTILSVVVAVPAAYAFSRFSFRAGVAFSSRSAAHMFPVDLSCPAVHPDAVCRPHKYPRLAGPDLSDLRSAACHLLLRDLRTHPGQLEQAARIDGAQAAGLHPDRHAAVGTGDHSDRDLLVHRRLDDISTLYLSFKEHQLTLPCRVQRFFVGKHHRLSGLMAASS